MTFMKPKTDTPATDSGLQEQPLKPTACPIDEDRLKPLLKRHLNPRTLVLPWESREKYERLRIGLVMNLKPDGKLEQVLVDNIVASMWRLQRCYRFETGLLAACQLLLAEQGADEKGAELLVPYDLTDILGASEEGVATPSPTDGQAEHRAANNWSNGSRPELVFHPALAEQAMAFVKNSHAGTLAPMQQYKKQIEDCLYRDLHELERLQAKRTALSAIPMAAMDLQFLDVDAELKRRAAATSGFKRRRRNRTGP